MDKSDTAILRNACGLISDLSNHLVEEMRQYSDQIIPVLQKVLNEESYDPDSKLAAIGTLGDLCLAIGPDYFSYLPTTFKSFKQASETSL